MKFSFKKIKKIYKKERQGFLFLTSGIILLLIYSGWRFHQLRILSFWGKDNLVGAVSQERKGSIPVYIKSYPVGIDIKIKEAEIVKGIWQVFPDSVSHLYSSGRIGEGKNIVIYGHNKDDVFGPIRYMKEGSEIELRDEKGDKFIYKVIKTDTVKPDNLDYVTPKNEELLTLYTCSGFFDSERFIVVAKKVN
jgi:LPXTG-site transpeptidase (sortase) family protein